MEYITGLQKLSDLRQKNKNGHIWDTFLTNMPIYQKMENAETLMISTFQLVGVIGFEPTAPSPPE